MKSLKTIVVFSGILGTWFWLSVFYFFCIEIEPKPDTSVKLMHAIIFPPACLFALLVASIALSLLVGLVWGVAAKITGDSE